MDRQAKRKRVEQILKAPIIVRKKNPGGIHRENDRIYAGQKYRGSEDADMSDFAVGFYHIVYRGIWGEKGLINEDGRLNNCNFAGDTINSFNTIANIVPEAGKSKAKRTCEEKWPEFLKEYSGNYRCLANFWILPMCIGRRSGKLNKYDSADVFLRLLKKDYGILRQYADYFEQMNNYCAFCKKHFLEKYEPISTGEMYRDGRAFELVKQAFACIKTRAESISSDDNVCENLYRYFDQLGIL